MHPRLNSEPDAVQLFQKKIDGKFNLRTAKKDAKSLSVTDFDNMVTRAYDSYVKETYDINQERSTFSVLNLFDAHSHEGMDRANAFVEETHALASTNANILTIFNKITNAIKGHIKGTLFRKHLAYHFLTISPADTDMIYRCDGDNIPWDKLANETYFFIALQSQAQQCY
ncbi:MAG: hypothetical protein ACD_45C00587G0002 [uncultured bacterium]|nr:MAG: hypothetical protein ACD_45C00587G0002 [uncultured bacterium]OGT46763.1 MAG: hypothetical protein A3E83_03675 [Gammaproteobacteria bacterium RIFCSPHIGHO2_12_FULL_41_20]